MASLAQNDPSLDLTLDTSIQTIRAETPPVQDEDDSFTTTTPLLQKPPPGVSANLLPSAVNRWRSEPDPELCLTPENTPAKIVHVEKHVRFEVANSVSSASYSSENKENSGNSHTKSGIVTELDRKTESTFKDEGKIIDRRIPALSDSNRKNESNFPEVKKYSYDVKITEQHDLRFGPKIENHRPKAIVKEIIQLPQNREIRPFPANLIDLRGVEVVHEHIFQKPELHSSLKLGKELLSLPGEKVKMKPKLEAKLQSTCVQWDRQREQDAALNFESEDLFTGHLTELDVSATGMVASLERERISKAPRVTSLESTRLQEHVYPEPDILQCWTDSLEIETYSSNLPGQSTTQACLTPAQPSSLYRHLRAWNL